MPKLNEQIRTWRSNADSKGENIPVGLLQAQLRDAARIVEMFTNSNHFEGVPMKVIVDYLTSALIDELGLDVYLNSTADALTLRAKIDSAMWRVKLQTEGGKWYDELAES